MQINRHTWHYRIIKSGIEYDEWMPKDLCSYCWSLILAVTKRVLTVVVASIFTFAVLNSVIADWVYGWYTLVKFGEKAPLWETSTTSGFWIVNVLMVFLVAGLMGGIVKQRIDDFKNKKCSLIEYKD